MERLTLGLLTYLLHSTILLGAAALLRGALRERRLALQEAVLRAALVGGVITAGLQVGLGVRPWGGVLEMPARPATVLSGAGRLGTVGTADSGPFRPASVDPSRAASPGPSWADSPLAAEASSFGVWADAARRLWRPGLAAAWGVLALLALARLGVAARRLRLLLRDRRPLEQRDLGWQTLAVAAGLGLRRPLRLSTAPRLIVPLATGVLRPEVCLPSRVLEELPAEERTALCGHELAHVARRDPAWILLARLIEALAPVQPLNWWARRRLQDLAECLSDDLAVAASAGPLSLARSLVDVACWAIIGNPVPPALAAGALSARSRLGHRVERLMDPLRAFERPSRLLLPLAALTVLATALVTPVVSGNAALQAEDVAPLATPQAMPEPAPPATPEPNVAAAVKGGVRGGVKGGVEGGVEGGVSADRRRAEAERELERLTERIELRSHRHQAEMRHLEAEIEALASRIEPNQQELERLSRQMEGAARQLAELSAEQAAGHATEGDSEKMAEARRHLEELRAEMKAKAASVRLPEAELREIHEKARALAELTKPSPQEIRELQQAAAELARQSLSDAALESPSASREIEQARDQVRRAQEEVRRANAELKRALEEARRAESEARREKHPERP